MLRLDAIDLLDLSEAGEMLLRDPVRLRRQIRTRQIPAALVMGTWGVPVPWAEAAAGLAPVDEESLRTYWLGRLAPPSTSAHRARRPATALGERALLASEEAATHLCADVRALHRLTEDRMLPALRVDGTLRYDAELVALLARDGDGDEVGAALAERLHEVRELAKVEYTTETVPEPVRFTPRVVPAAPPEAPSPVVVPAPKKRARPSDAPAESAPSDEVPAAAKAWEMPEDLRSNDIHSVEPGPSKLLDADGFEAVDEY